MPNLTSARIFYRNKGDTLVLASKISLQHMQKLSIHVERFADVVKFLLYVLVPRLFTLSIHFTISSRRIYPGTLYPGNPPELSQLSSLSITCTDLRPRPVSGLIHFLNIMPELQSLRLSHLTQWGLVVDALVSTPYPCLGLALLELGGTSSWADSLSPHMERLLKHRGPEGVCPIRRIRIAQ